MAQRVEHTLVNERQTVKRAEQSYAAKDEYARVKVCICAGEARFGKRNDLQTEKWLKNFHHW